MHLIQILLPLYDENGESFSSGHCSVIRKELADKFGGITTYTRSPAVGLWKETENKTVRDEIIIFELMIAEVDELWWSNYKIGLEKLFKQDIIVIRSWEITLL